MLDLAIKAGIPIVQAQTTDTLNLVEVLKFWSKGIDATISMWPGALKKAEPDTLYYHIGDGDTVTEKLYYDLVDKNSAIVFVTPESVPLAFNVGEIQTPPALLKKYLSQVVGDVAEKMLPSVRGLTIKEMVEVLRLVTARDEAVTERGIKDMRAQIKGRVSGMQEVQTGSTVYLPPADLVAWMADNAEWFLSEKVAPALRPRGLLFDGDPGTGKTQAAKYIAKHLGIPLFHLELGDMLTRWHGESEANLRRLLRAADDEEPCALLIDEAEKLFEGTDEGTTRRMLGQLLWWMQERTSRVFVVLTTNSRGKLPPELYRAGRIDKVFVLEKLGLLDARKLGQEILKQHIANPASYVISRVDEAIAIRVNQQEGAARVSPAEIVSTVHSVVKSILKGVK